MKPKNVGQWNAQISETVRKHAGNAAVQRFLETVKKALELAGAGVELELDKSDAAEFYTAVFQSIEATMNPMEGAALFVALKKNKTSIEALRDEVMGVFK